MALKVIIPRQFRQHNWVTLAVRVALLGIATVALMFVIVFGYLYVKYQRVVDERLKQPIFASTAKVYAAPRQVRIGQKLSVHLIANELSAAGYSADGASQTSELGTYKQGAQTITVRPGPQSYHAPDRACFESATELSSRSPTNKASRWPAMNWSRS